ncbi:MAG: Bis(5-nucleosyl)-tetraphosphatase, symmetrical [Pseudomonadota bacterium]|jgi:bis(5'-nucleosyl)-tetraphosphatase (symmetrical)
MATYIIGDVQGCYEPLRRLLDKIRFDDKRDTIWFTGDLVNRGPDSLGVLRFVYTHRYAMRTVLGNHDITLLAVAEEAILFQPDRHTFADILQDGQRDEYVYWLKQAPLAHYDAQEAMLLVHAGIVPNWDLSLTLSLAKEAETALKSEQSATLLRHLYGDKPNHWSPDLIGWDRLRFIVNVFTRIRFCTPAGVLDLKSKEGQHKAPADYVPWFEVVTLQEEMRIFFGHWAALEGRTGTPQAIALDTGCVWGKKLTAYHLESSTRYCLDCPGR